ncbi:MAG: hypothetical protein ACREJ2_11685 [Planctomycetota bacterium]
MQLSWRMILAPWVGAFGGWLASHGFALAPDQTLALTVLAAAIVANLMHLLEQWIGPHAAAPVKTIIKAADPAKKPPGSSPIAAILLPLVLVIPIMFALGSCSALGLAPAKSTDESIAYGYGLYTAVEEALSASVAAGQVTKSTAIAVDREAGNARELLDAARAAELVNPSGASSDLMQATEALEVLQTWLDHPNGSPPR